MDRICPLGRTFAVPPPRSDTVRPGTVCVPEPPRFAPTFPPRLKLGFPPRFPPTFPPRLVGVLTWLVFPRLVAPGWLPEGRPELILLLLLGTDE
jgi:hypothetical protein